MARTRLGKYFRLSKEKFDPIVSDREITISKDIDGDPLVWCADPAGDNPDVVIVAKRGKIISVSTDGEV